MKKYIFPTALVVLLPQFALACYFSALTLSDAVHAVLDIAVFALFPSVLFGGLVYLRTRFAKKYVERSNKWRLKVSIIATVIFWFLALIVASTLVFTTYFSKPCTVVPPDCVGYCNPI